MLAQQVSLESARSAYSRLLAAAGRVTPGRVARLGVTRLRRAGLTRQKAAYCHALATGIVERTLSLGDAALLDDRAARDRLVQITGVGPWTADIYLLMALGRPDVWPNGDLALAKATQRVKALRSPPSPAALERIAAPWAPWRAVAARILWHFYLSRKKQADESAA